MTAPTKLTPGERRTLERVVFWHMHGLEFERQPFLFAPKGATCTVCKRWVSSGLLYVELCRHVDDVEARETAKGYGLTAKGVAWARSLGFRVGSEEET